MSDNNEIQARSILQEMTPYTPGKPIWEVQRELGLDKVIKLASNENPLGPSPKAIEAIAKVLPELHRYPDADASKLKQVIAAAYDVDMKQLIVTNGGDELITLVSEAFIDAGDEVVVPVPSFSEYRFAGLLMGANIRSVPLNLDFTYDIEAILRAVTARTKIVYLCSPNNPTGTILTRKELQQILDNLPKHVLVVLDTAYSHFTTGNEYTDGLEFVRAGFPLLILQTFSKIYGLAGIRVGFGIAPAGIIQSINQVKEPFNVNTLAQVAAIAAVGDIDHVRSTQLLVVEEREKLYAALRELGLDYTESMSNFILVELGTEAKSQYERLMAKGVIVRYGQIWDLPKHIRVSIGLPEENARFIEVLREIAGKSL
ncbi:histidinol-phosphate transaminase [Paenibacillus psychroresistens]|uniref:Histidinol-phosphate aminotransferase n=1 Tax=Paenibacillus psychroresistens TaxID=1778678 RepID=A0A6B8RE55_9BACL|nr:histidinol-phosphate transaminase [Paenibacillus psychroresistens]QGQ94004.1 histidinol-phosphate transaminase [Paenibacillus psychroresistens]